MKYNLFKFKRGDITVKQLVTIIILIVSFSIILLFLFMLNLRETVDKEACRNSVVMRNIFKGFGKLVVQFNCKTQDLLIQETEPNAIYGELAEAQQDCFWMMGGGEIDIGDNVCAICNIVEFETDVGSLSQEGYYKYLEENKVSGGDISYLEYFYKGSEIEKQESFVFNSDKKYFIYYIFDSAGFFQRLIPGGVEGDLYRTGILPYNSESIEKLKCSGYATNA